MNQEPFLKEIAALLLTRDDFDLSRTCVVFPNKRARLYLSKYLGELTDKPVWAPRYASINELMENLSGCVYADRLTLVFELFEIYGSLSGHRENFENFYTYADALLADFDEIDKYLVNAHDLFSNLAGLKALEGRFSYLTEEQIAAIHKFWNTFDPANTSEGQKTFISLWNILADLYDRLRERLYSKGLAYEGMAYRKVAEMISRQENFQGLIADKYLFVGFNALNACENRLFRYLQHSGRAEFYWDYDTWYVENKLHEGGTFMRRNITEFPESHKLNHDNMAAGDKQFYFLPVPSNIGQASVVSYVFDLLANRNDQHTAIVLADETLLLPVLYAIPPEVTDLNVTMGYPVIGSVVFNLVDALYENGKTRRKNAEGKTVFYYKDVISIITNPLMEIVYREKIRDIRKLIFEKNRAFLEIHEIVPGSAKELIFREDLPENPCSFLVSVFESVLRRLAEPPEGEVTDSVQMEIVYQVYSFLVRLKDVLSGYSFAPGYESLFGMIRRMLRTLHIPFNGEPLAGLQLLGVLETRTLDFDNVIILSVNEGILPGASMLPSFIPQNLRVGFGLPAAGHQDSIFAYYFYRLIQRAGNIYLLYDNSTGGMQTGERSRFMHQLFYELPERVKEINLSFPVSLIPALPIVVEKTGDVAEKLMKYTGEGDKVLSPSAMNEFINCPLRFYYHHIAGLPQPEEVSEEIDARIFGNILHKAMQFLYEKFGAETVTPDKLDYLLKHDEGIAENLDKAFAVILYGQTEGENPRKIEGFDLIVHQILHAYIRNLIYADKQEGSFEITGLEKYFDVRYSVHAGNNTISVHMGGTIDRVDRHNGKTRIIDYKTGTAKNSFKSVDSLFDGNNKNRNDGVFQVFMYSMIYLHKFPEDVVIPALCFVRDSHVQGFSYKIQFGEKKKELEDFSQVREAFEALFDIHLGRLFDLNKPFAQTDELQHCRNCPYAVICRREGI